MIREAKARKCEMSKQAMRAEAERLVKEALERKNLTVNGMRWLRHRSLLRRRAARSMS